MTTKVEQLLAERAAKIQAARDQLDSKISALWAEFRAVEDRATLTLKEVLPTNLRDWFTDCEWQFIYWYTNPYTCASFYCDKPEARLLTYMPLGQLIYTLNRSEVKFSWTDESKVRCDAPWTLLPILQSEYGLELTGIDKAIEYQKAEVQKGQRMLDILDKLK